MTPSRDGDVVPDAALRTRVLAERTAALAARGEAPQRMAVLPPRLVCEVGALLVGLDPALVGSVRAAAAWPTPFVAPGASGRLIGLFAHGGHPYGLADLAALLGAPLPPDDAREAAAHGTMLLLKGRRLALRVERVLGLLALPDAGDGRHGVLPPDGAGPRGEAPAEAGRLVLLLDPLPLLASLDGETAGA